MFIPRTLAEKESSGRAAWARAAIVGGFLALALFAVLSVNVGSGQVNLAAGDVANADITAPISTSYFSKSLTEAARTAAAEAVIPVYEEIAPRADIRIASCACTTTSRARCGSS
jgi:membrane-associated HD superfamily phosphohydrolase